ncbi:PepSY domain-containing protein [Novosphingobium sp. 9U]|uniref:PepSY domain-containing protein n=1 Tax=Novosphingobium sp. 9U TaxID=2653158 RepID=UPI001359AC09|nr:PepSY domain-containing protein [Novosphingobium sp. 9U]
MNRQFSSRALALAACATSLVAIPVDASQGGEQNELRRDRRAHKVRPTREIEQLVLPQMSGMQYLGPEYDPTAMTYRLKFIRNGRVVFVDVDAQSGAIIGRW